MKLLSSESPLNRSPPAGQWQIVYSGLVVDCRDESQAKILARALLTKGLKASARLVNGPITLWTVDGRHQIRAWLSNGGQPAEYLRPTHNKFAPVEKAQ